MLNRQLLVGNITARAAAVRRHPDRYRALVWLGACAGLRISEALGFEHGPRGLDVDNEELHVVQQLRYSPRDCGGFYRSEPKSRSSGTVDLDPMSPTPYRHT